MGWCRQLWADLTAPSGYTIGAKLLAAAAALWISLYTVASTQYEFFTGLALDEGNRIIELASSGNSGFVSAMTEFREVREEALQDAPGVLLFWWRRELARPNEGRLNDWAKRFLSRCTPETCGGDGYRVRLDSVDLSNTVLNGANLSNANLSNANLRCADLSDADLSNANLLGSNLTEADLRNANLTRVLYWTPSQFEIAAYWDTDTEWPPGYTPEDKEKTPQLDSVDSCGRRFRNVQPGVEVELM